LDLDWQSWLRLGFFGIVGLVAVAWIAMHVRFHTKATPIESFANLTTQLGQGQPTLLYFYSNF
jgi:hypothetical protein